MLSVFLHVFVLDFADIYEKMKSLLWNVKPSLRFSRKLCDIMASRACRSAIMIGSPLNQSEMNKIVSNLSDLENPWVFTCHACVCK